MRNLRPLLRLEDKVAAEGRRLEVIGGPPLRGVAPVAFLVAAILHGLFLLLPAVRARAALPMRSVAADFPLVWRPMVDAAPQSSPAVATRRDPSLTPGRSESGSQVQAASQSPVAAVVVQPTPARSVAAAPAAPLLIEPVPEPAPELTLAMISAEIEAIIPNPDTPPPSLEVGPPPGSTPDGPLSPIERVTPVYPRAARTMLAEGRVRLRLFVLPDGTVDRATVEECSRKGLGFEASALAAVKRWRYEPVPPQSGVRNVVVTIHFQQPEDRR